MIKSALFTSIWDGGVEVTSSCMVDIGSTTHYVRVFDWRGIELGKVFRFSNSREGFENFKDWMWWLQDKYKKSDVIVGIEPTGHYWFGLGFRDYEAQSSMLLLKVACTPKAVMELGAEKINPIWRDAKLRAVGMKRAMTLCETAKRSIGLKKGSSAAEYEMKLLLEDYKYKIAQQESIMDEIESLCKKIPESEQMLAIKGIGIITVAGFLAEVGDVRRFESPRQIQKLAGLSLRENS